ncbi:MAG: FtsH protease activity modulator HflK [Deltaproteobacteria bacterium]|nr:FtsH protease activity modulator HflK [Deltaproteobacteria bacterium]MBW2052074.1 FtsH protease activity modulator HflK [Deltaproteobacteria bacterium]MBW2140853.1 FtsH protease activity modulator HflK [Deltaproteobacteria bacterium]MBW2322412.1 FtsH protease activity modulator HflK [Deltaproteobacteria bacterium]
MPMDWEKWQKEGQGSPDLDKVVADFKRIGKKLPSVYIIVVIVILIWLLSGIYIVAPDQLGVVKRFGKYTTETGPGPHYHFPYPIETVMKPKVTQVRRFEIGYRTIHPGPPPRYRPVPVEALMLTGDENIVDIQFIVQYLIKHPTNYLFRIEDPVKTIKDATEAAMREVIGNGKIDDVLTAGKFRIQQDTKLSLQKILDNYESGLEVVAVQLQKVQPPEQVIAAFKDVASAREDQNRYINEAEGYANDLIPKAKGKAAEIVQQAKAYKESKIKRAQGDASRFLSLLKEYQKAKHVTRKRLYLETMEKILAESHKFILSDGATGVLPLLPLQSIGGGQLGQTSKQPGS